MTRQQQIKAGKLWCVHPDGVDENEFEGSRTACLRYIRERFGMRAYKTGKIRLGQIILEDESPELPQGFGTPPPKPSFLRADAIPVSFDPPHSFTIPILPAPIVGETRRVNLSAQISA
jgi:hypothetical protein